MSTAKKQKVADKPPVPPDVQRAIDFVRALATRYTKHEGHLRVDGGQVGDQIVLALRGHADDHPRLVGSKGANIWALQWLVTRLGAHMGRRIRLTLLEPNTGQKGPLHEFLEDPHWRPDSTLALLEMVLASILPCTEVETMHLDGLCTFTVKMAGNPDINPEELRNALHTILHAIGKTEGQQVHVEVCPPMDPKAAVPANGSARA